MRLTKTYRYIQTFLEYRSVIPPFLCTCMVAEDGGHTRVPLKSPDKGNLVMSLMFTTTNETEENNKIQVLYFAAYDLES